MVRSLYRIVAKAAKCTSYVVIGQLLMEPMLIVEWLPQLLSIIPGIIIRTDCLANPPLVMPIVSEALFIVNKLMDGMIKMNVSLTSTNDLSVSCNRLIGVCRQITASIVDRCLEITKVGGDDCFDDKVAIVDEACYQQNYHFRQSVDMRHDQIDSRRQSTRLDFLRLLRRQIVGYLHFSG